MLWRGLSSEAAEHARRTKKITRHVFTDAAMNVKKGSRDETAVGQVEVPFKSGVLVVAKLCACTRRSVGVCVCRFSDPFLGDLIEIGVP